MEQESANKPDYLISVASILHNDEAIVEHFVREVIAQLRRTFRYFELVLIDNRSTDETSVRLTSLLSELPGIRVVRLSRERKREIALSALLDHCIGDFVITLDCRSDPVDLIPKISDMLVAGCDVVIGQNRSTHSSWLRGVLSGFSRWLAGSILEIDTVRKTGLCHGFTRRALNSITRIRSKSRFILYDSMVIGYRREVLLYLQEVRPGARMEVEPLFESLNGYVQMVVAHSLFPLRLAGLLGVFASLANLGYLLYIFAIALFKRRIAEGWLTTSLLNTSMFFTLFVILTILSEYLGRILDESKDLPTYFVESESSSAVSTYDQRRLNVVTEQ
jgi:glycosyltransferase involved in cell wall biosynthesis